MTGKHRTPNGSATRRVVAVALALVVAASLGMAGWYGYDHHAKPGGCSSQTDSSRTDSSRTDLSLSAAPEIAPALRQVAAAWNAADTKVSSRCVRVRVTSAAPSDTASVIAAAHGASIGGLGKPNGDMNVPDVWVPDSSMWLFRLQSASTPVKLSGGHSIASSPIVVAAPRPVAATLPASGSGAAPKWTDLLTKLRSGTVKSGIVNPNVDASGLAALLAVGSAITTGAVNPAQKAAVQMQTVAAIHALAGGSSLGRDDLLGRFPRSNDPATLARNLAAAPLPEQSVLAYNGARPAVPLVGLYASPAPTPMDYPYVQLAGLGSVKATAAAKFAARLRGYAWTNDLARVDLRASDGTYGVGMTNLPTMPAGTLKPTTASVAQALSAWSAVTVPGRMLAVIDVSASMAISVPSAGGHTREQVTVAAAQSGLYLFDDAWSVGLWTFSTNLDGAKPYRQLAPIAPLATSRGRMLAALSGIRSSPNSNTGLYDTVLAAYKQVQQGWDPSRVNSVVIMTDGRNDNPGALTLDQLLSQVKSISDPKRPVEVIAIGIGNDVDKAALDKITAATGGGAFVATDPTQIGDIFLKAVALRSGAAK